MVRTPPQLSAKQANRTTTRSPIAGDRLARIIVANFSSFGLQMRWCPSSHASGQLTAFAFSCALFRIFEQNMRRRRPRRSLRCQWPHSLHE